MRDSVEKEVEEMLRELDLDGDGKVRMEDFVRLLVSDQVNGEKNDRYVGTMDKERRGNSRLTMQYQVRSKQCNDASTFAQLFFDVSSRDIVTRRRPTPPPPAATS